MAISSATGGIGTFPPPNTETGVNDVGNANAAQNPGGQVTSVSMAARADQIAILARTAFPPPPAPSSSEQGHGSAPSAAEQAYAKAMEKYEAALAKYEADLAAHNSANTQNAAIDSANAPLEEQAAFWEEMKSSLLKVTTHGLAGDSHLSMNELRTLLTSTDPGQRSAADFILSNWDKIPATKLPDWGGCMNTNDMRDAAVQAGREAASNRNLKQKHVAVPPHPGSPPNPPAAPGATAPTSQSNASTGTSNSGATGGTGGTTDPSGSAPTDGSKPPQTTPDEFRAKALENSNKVPAFSSSATTGEGRMQDGLQYCQNKLEALQSDLASAAARGDQGAISLINSEIAKFQAGLSALMQMMKQQQEVQSNMSKMFNDMAAAAIRNMR